MSNPLRMHIHDDATAALRERIFDYARDRMQLDPPPLDKGMPFAELRALMPDTVTEKGIGGDKAMSLFGDILAPASMSTDHPAMVSFIPVAPTEGRSCSTSSCRRHAFSVDRGLKVPVLSTPRTRS